MRLLFRSRAATVALLVTLVTLGATSSPCAESLPEELRHLPQSNPYRPVLANYLAIPRDDRRALSTWANPPPPAKDDEPTAPPPEASVSVIEAAHVVVAGLATASTRSRATSADWPLVSDPISPETALGLLPPETTALRELASIAAKIASSKPPAEALAIHVSIARLGREVSHGATFIHQVLAAALEEIALRSAARDLSRFSAEELEALIIAWRALPPRIGLDPVVAKEREAVFRPLCEHVIRPGVIALAANENGDEASPDTRNILALLGDMSPESRRTWLQGVRAHPGGPDGYSASLLENYDDIADALIMAASRAKAAPEPTPPTDPFLAMFAGPFAKVARTRLLTDTLGLMLEAAILHQLGRGQESPADPWAEPGESFAATRGADGAWTIRSAFERRPNRPLTYKFAAPDAGFVRPGSESP